MSDLTHFDGEGRAVMVDVSAKAETAREAVAKGSVVMAPATVALIQSRGIAKGDVLAVAQLAGIMAAKRTPDLVPLCHPLALSAVEVALTLDPARNAVDIVATCRVSGRTGVEMEALTVYDMVKAVDKAMRITDIRLVRKSGGKSGLFEAE